MSEQANTRAISKIVTTAIQNAVNGNCNVEASAAEILLLISKESQVAREANTELLRRTRTAEAKVSASFKLAARLCDQNAIRTINGHEYLPREGVMESVVSWRQEVDNIGKLNLVGTVRSALANPSAPEELISVAKSLGVVEQTSKLDIYELFQRCFKVIGSLHQVSVWAMPDGSVTSDRSYGTSYHGEQLYRCGSPPPSVSCANDKS